jgi:uncharacterized membrane protein
MSDLVAIAFDKPEEADRVLTELVRLKKEYLIDLEDAVVVIRQPDGVVNLKQSVNPLGIGAASGGIRGALFGARWSDCCFSIRWPALRWAVSWEPEPGPSLDR